MSTLLAFREVPTRILSLPVAGILAGLMLVPGEYTQEELRELDSMETAQGGTLEFVNTPQGLLVGGSNILTANVPARNGIIHVITEVLIP